MTSCANAPGPLKSNVDPIGQAFIYAINPDRTATIVDRHGADHVAAWLLEPRPDRIQGA